MEMEDGLLRLPLIFSGPLSDNVSQELKFFETLPLENERMVSQRITCNFIFFSHKISSLKLKKGLQ